MIKVNVLVVGKIKEKYYIDAINEYQKMAKKYCDISIIEVAEENYKKVDDAIIKTIKEKEGERLLPKLKGYIIALSPEGEKFSSKQFASEIKKKIDGGNGNFTFVVGGSYGIDSSVKERANSIISFSDMTFPHTLFRVMLVEQIYRAFSIIGGSAYDK